MSDRGLHTSSGGGEWTRSAEQHPPRRNALMVAAYVVWGAALGAILASRDNRSRYRQSART
jgi:hypothetical protein